MKHICIRLIRSLQLNRRLSAAIAVFMTLLLSCNYTDKKTTTDSPVENAAKNKRTVDCYTYQKDKDTIYLKLDLDGKNAKGELVYSLYEKDLNKGTLNGDMKGDTLIADYSFSSEGTKSIRQVAFLKQGDSFVEGYGEVEEKNGKMVFKNINGLRFGNLVLTKVECVSH